MKKKNITKEEITIQENNKKVISKKRMLEICKGLLTFLIFYFSSYLQVIPITLFKVKNTT